MRQQVRVSGTVPVKNQATRVLVCLPAVSDCSDPANFAAVPYNPATDSFVYEEGDGPEFELLMQQNPEGVCGYQFDPGSQYGNRMTFHVLQGAGLGTTYVIRFELDQVNWNEWNPAECYGFNQGGIG